MNKDILKKEWKKLLIDNDVTEKELALKIGTKQQTLNKKINSGSIRYIEFEELLNALGYELVWQKKA